MIWRRECTTPKCQPDGHKHGCGHGEETRQFADHKPCEQDGGGSIGRIGQGKKGARAEGYKDASKQRMSERKRNICRELPQGAIEPCEHCERASN